MMVTFGTILKILFVLLLGQNKMHAELFKPKIQRCVCGNYQSVMQNYQYESIQNNIKIELFREKI